MNVHVPRPIQPVPRRFDVAEVARMAEAGILGEDERIELIGGELVRMAAKGVGHEIVKARIVRLLNRSLPEAWFVGIEPSLRLGPSTLLEPDILVCRFEDVGASPEGYLSLARPPGLVIEVSDTSIAHDLGRKAALYAAHGVPDYWVVEAGTRIARLHREPGPEGYRSVVEIGPESVLRPLCPDLDMIALHLGSIV